MRWITPLLVVALSAAAAIFADTPAANEKEGTASKKAPSKKTAAGKNSKSSKKTTAAAVPRRPAQQHPTAERYKEIQQALADKGYLTGPVDGNWSQESADALQRFQHDQNLNEDGKIGSLSLIALGLGPKRAATDQPTTTLQQPSAQQP